MDTLARIVVCSVLCQIAMGLEIVNPEDTTTNEFLKEVNVGDSLNLKCQANYNDDESIGTNPIKWHKTQEEQHHDNPEAGEEVSNLASLNSAFDSLGRFAVDFDYPSSRLNLAITNIQGEDSGYYFCYGKKDGVVHYIRYEVRVQVEYDAIELTGEGENANSSQDAVLIFREHSPGSVRCEASGGYPEATLRMYIEGEETPLTGKSGSEIVRRGENIGLQRMTATSYLQINSVNVRPNQNGKEIICEIVSQNNQIKASRVLMVTFGPTNLDCDKEPQATLEDENVVFGCRFEANPAPEHVKWIVRSRPDITEVDTTGQIVDDQYRATFGVTNTPSESTGFNLFETKFTILKVREDHFQTYEVEIKSDGFPQISQNFVLKRGERQIPDEGPVNGASYTSVSFAILLSPLALILFKIQRQ